MKPQLHANTNQILGILDKEIETATFENGAIRIKLRESERLFTESNDFVSPEQSEFNRLLISLEENN